MMQIDVPWHSSLEIMPKTSHEYWVRYTGTDWIYRWLCPLTNKWIEEPDQINMKLFGSWGEADVAARNSPQPPAWKSSFESFDHK